MASRSSLWGTVHSAGTPKMAIAPCPVQFLSCTILSFESKMPIFCHGLKWSRGRRHTVACLARADRSALLFETAGTFPRVFLQPVRPFEGPSIRHAARRVLPSILGDFGVWPFDARKLGRSGRYLKQFRWYFVLQGLEGWREEEREIEAPGGPGRGGDLAGHSQGSKTRLGGPGADLRA